MQFEAPQGAPTLEPELLTASATASMMTAPPISRIVVPVPNWAACTPAGLPGASGEVPAAIACDPVKTTAIAAAVIAFPNLVIVCVPAKLNGLADSFVPAPAY